MNASSFARRSLSRTLAKWRCLEFDTSACRVYCAGRMRAWTVLKSRVLLERRWLRLREDHVRLPSGAEIDAFHVIEGRDWAAVLALTEGSRVVLVDQYRHGLSGVSRELPAGVVDPGETPLETAQRELLEETGYRAGQWLPLCSVSTEPSRHTTRAHFFLARDARRVSAPKLEESEHIEVALVEPRELLQLVRSGRIQHGVHIGAILLAAHLGVLAQSDAPTPG